MMVYINKLSLTLLLEATARAACQHHVLPETQIAQEMCVPEEVALPSFEGCEITTALSADPEPAPFINSQLEVTSHQ